MDVRARARKLEEDLRRRNVREYAAAAVLALGCVVLAVMGTGTYVLRLACAAGVASAASVALKVHRAGRHASPTHDGASDESFRATLRSALARQRDLLSTTWRWYVAPYVATMALFLVSAYLELVVPRAVVAATACATLVLSAAVVVVNRRAAARMQRELDALDAEP